MYSFLVAMLVIVCLTMIVVVLMQSSKGGGLAGVFGGGQAGAVFGVRRTADLLTKITVVLATTFMVLSLVINLFFLPGTGTAADSILQREAPRSVPPPQIPDIDQPSAPAAQPGTEQQPGTEDLQQ